jgi:hypothetical protein
VAVGTNNQSDREVEKALSATVELLKQMEAHAKGADAAFRGLGKTMESLRGVQHGAAGLGGAGDGPVVNRPSAGSPAGRQGAAVRSARRDAAIMRAGSMVGSLGSAGSVGGVLSSLVGSASKAAPVLGLVAGSLTAMYAAGEAAQKRNLMVAQSLKTMGQALSAADSATLATANNANETAELWKIAGANLQKGFEGFFAGVIGVLNDAAKVLNNNSVGVGTDKLAQGNAYGASDAIMKYVLDLETRSENSISRDTSLPVLSGIAADALQSGFSMGSANNLALGTFDAAQRLALETGGKPADVAKQLAGAVFSGSDAAKAYGVNVSENVLSGWMSERGYDPYVEYNDAAMQAMRYQLMLEQLGYTSKEALGEQNREWAMLGDQINAAKQTLFSFDEVIQLSARETWIPEITDREGSFRFPVEVAEAEKAGEKAKNELDAFLEKNPAFVPLFALLDEAEIAQILEWIRQNPGQIDVLLASAPTDDINAFKGWIADNPGLQGVDVDIDTLPVQKFMEEISNVNVPLKVTPTIDKSVIPSLAEVIGSGSGKQGTSQFPANTTSPSLMQVLSSVGPGGSTGPAQTASSLMDLLTQNATPTASSRAGVSSGGGGYSESTVTGAAEAFHTQHGGVASMRHLSGEYSMSDIEAAIHVEGLSNWQSLSDAQRVDRVKARVGHPFKNAFVNLLGDDTPGFASGGIGTKEMDARLFEGDRAEAVIPLETAEGIDYLSRAMQQAGASSGDEIHVHLSMSGIFDTDDAYKWRQVATKIGNQIEINKRQRGL